MLGFCSGTVQNSFATLTCLTLAAMHSVKGEVILFAMRLQMLRENEAAPLMSSTLHT